MDLQSVQTKLIHTIKALDQTNTDVQVDWAGEPGPPARSKPGVDFSTAVDALQWRSVQAGQRNAGTPVAPEVYVKRLNAMADKINHLSAQQEQAIAEMQSIQGHLSHLQPQAQYSGQRSAPALNLKRVTLAAAQVDEHGNILLSHRPLKPDLPFQPTASPHPSLETPRELADHLRVTYGSPTPQGQGGWRNLVAEALTLGREPAQLAAGLGRGIWQLALGITQGSRPKPIRTPFANSSTPPLTLADGALWFGGGVIGRLALNLLLAAFPAFWSVAVAAFTALITYALYRATLAPKLAFGPAIRVFLLMLGLVIGSQL